MENQYKLIVSYVGTQYCGWQAQEIGKTISQTMQKSFERTFQAPCTLLGASRTDAGVHALHQVVLCSSSINMSIDTLLQVWHNALPLDIMIRHIERVDEDFNPFHNVLYKIYSYTIYKKRPNPPVAPFGWFYSYKINIETLKQSLDLFVGTHDFLAFSSAEPNIQTTRTIDSISIVENQEKIVIMIKGKSFIRHMIRRIVGAAVIVSSHKAKKFEDIIMLLKMPSLTYSFETAPACGLSLEHIEYEKNYVRKVI